MRKQSLLLSIGAAILACGATAASASPPKPFHAHHRCHAWRHAAVEHRFVAHRWHDGGMAMGERWGERERGHFEQDEWRSSHEEDRSWSDAEGGGWAYEGYERPSAVDRYGFLTWPGKTHFGHDQQMEGPEAGPPPPEEGPPPPPPPEDGYEIRRF